MQAAAYVRVSTAQQSLEAQKAAILKAATARGDEISHWYGEKISGYALERAALASLRHAVRRGEHKKVYVFRIDRLSRAGVLATFTVVDDLTRNGCSVATVADAFDLDGPAGPIVLAVLATCAEMERKALSDRISAARERVEREGGQWGRPRRVDPGTLAKAQELRAQGHTLRYVSAALKIPRATLQGALAGKGHYATPRLRVVKTAT
jgi:DNA invertase Pin-like site-specific DNA recombinase